MRSRDELFYEINNFFETNQKTHFYYKETEQTEFRCRKVFNISDTGLYIYLDFLEMKLVEKIFRKPNMYLLYFKEFIIQQFKITYQEVVTHFYKYDGTPLILEYDVHSAEFDEKTSFRSQKARCEYLIMAY